MPNPKYFSNLRIFCFVSTPFSLVFLFLFCSPGLLINILGCFCLCSWYVMMKIHYIYECAAIWRYVPWTNKKLYYINTKQRNKKWLYSPQYFALALFFPTLGNCRSQKATKKIFKKNKKKYWGKKIPTHNRVANISSFCSYPTPFLRRFLLI